MVRHLARPAPAAAHCVIAAVCLLGMAACAKSGSAISVAPTAAQANCASIALTSAVFNLDAPAFSSDGYSRLDTAHRRPLAYGLSLYTPTREYPAQPLVKCGYLDVTKPPFNAKGDGIADDTTALRQAVDAARRYMLATYVPAGTYKVSDTIECSSRRIRPASMIPDRPNR